MATSKSSQTNPGSGNNGSQSSYSRPVHYDNFQKNWAEFDGFSIGYANAPQVLNASGYADSSLNIALQGVALNDHASIQISLGNAVNLDAFANVAASGTVTSTATSDGFLTLNNARLSGTYTASMSVDVTAYLAATHASVHLQIIDNFQLSLSGTGYAGTSIATTSASGGTVVSIAPGGGSASHGNNNGAFDLARFAASVLNTGEFDMAFVASTPGETLQGLATSVLTINATADLPNSYGLAHLSFHDTERTNLAFYDTSSQGGGTPFGIQGSGADRVSLFHNG